MAAIELDLMENGWIMQAVWERARTGDPVARSLYRKIKAAPIADGVVWYYGDPWAIDGRRHIAGCLGLPGNCTCPTETT